MAAKGNKNEFYLGNPNLPNKHWKGEYTKAMVEDIKKSRQNLLYFAENFFYIIDPDEGKVKINLFPYQKKSLRTLRDNRKVILLASRQIGKALDCNTPVPTPRGWTTMGELKTGDQVFDENGDPCNVIEAHNILHNRNCYEVTFDNGEVIVADEEHLWFTQNRQERRVKCKGSVKSTKQLYETLFTYGNEPNHRIPKSQKGVNYDAKILPIEPYILGLWLGDGACKGASITVGHRDIAETLHNLRQSTQFDVITVKQYDSNTNTIRLSSSVKPNTNSLHALIKANLLWGNKHIPDIYLNSSREQRLELLQGLIDSDGYITKTGVCQFYNSNEKLLNDARKLIESLGYKVTKKLYMARFGNELFPTGCLTFTPIEIVAKLSFKTSRIKCREFVTNSALRNQWHYIKQIVPTTSRPVRCITVDSKNNLYLCGNQYIPTHNTTMLTIYALWVAAFNDFQNIIIVANKEATAIEIFRRVRLAYEELPNWLKPGVKEYGKTSCEFENGSRIGISTTTGSAARGTSINCVDGSSIITVRNKHTQEIEKITMEQLLSRVKVNGVMETSII